MTLSRRSFIQAIAARGGNAGEFDQQPQMFQPVGGIDALPRAFAARLGERISYGAEVRAIRKHQGGVRIAYRDAHGIDRALDADYAICTIPLTVLKSIPADWSPRMRSNPPGSRSRKSARAAKQPDRAEKISSW